MNRANINLNVRSWKGAKGVTLQLCDFYSNNHQEAGLAIEKKLDCIKSLRDRSELYKLVC